ncbi:MAG: hypothetical protein IPM18_08380 [Phycisphaerales bacterium]|nr:hypothetical protein [Phycisphaerales bacterium]
MPTTSTRIQIDRVLPVARAFLTVALDDGKRDLWVVEHAERVMRLTRMIAGLPEVGGHGANLTALAAAALFHDAGWLLEYNQRRYPPAQLLSRPTSDIQRELGAAILHDEVGDLLPGPTVQLASDAIRQCNHRNTTLLEAQILAEAEALDEIGMLYVLRQFRQYQSEGRPIQQLVDSWSRQKEYHYWDVRLQDGFRWKATRGLAESRLADVETFMAALARDLSGGDLTTLWRVHSGDGTPAG